MGKITKFAKAQAKKAPMPMMAKKGKAMPAMPPPASEGEVPDAAPAAPPVQATSAPKMVAAPKSGLSMRKPFTA